MTNVNMCPSIFITGAFDIVRENHFDNQVINRIEYHSWIRLIYLSSCIVENQLQYNEYVIFIDLICLFRYRRRNAMTLFSSPLKDTREKPIDKKMKFVYLARAFSPPPLFRTIHLHQCRSSYFPLLLIVILLVFILEHLPY